MEAVPSMHGMDFLNNTVEYKYEYGTKNGHFVAVVVCLGNTFLCNERRELDRHVIVIKSLQVSLLMQLDRCKIYT